MSTDIPHPNFSHMVSSVVSIDPAKRIDAVKAFESQVLGLESVPERSVKSYAQDDALADIGSGVISLMLSPQATPNFAQEFRDSVSLVAPSRNRVALVALKGAMHENLSKAASEQGALNVLPVVRQLKDAQVFSGLDHIYFPVLSFKTRGSRNGQNE